MATPDDRIAELLREHPCTTANDVALVMAEQLDVALHGHTWARPDPPMAVWRSLLAEAAQLARPAPTRGA